METPITTIESALAWAYNVLKDMSDTYHLDARILLCEVMKVKLDYLIRYPQRAMTVQQISEFQNLVASRARGEPIAYLLGRQSFYDIDVIVTPDVLIPRPETELLVEKAVKWAKGNHAFIVDVGAGSGVIALALAKHLPTAHVTGIDVSQAALDIARKNAEYLGLSSRIRWLQGNLLQPILENGETADLIVANLPYIPTEEMKRLEVSQHEPHLALDGGADGLDVIRSFLQDAPKVLRERGLLLMEIGSGQGQAVKEFAQTMFPTREITIEPDLAGHERIVSVLPG